MRGGVIELLMKKGFGFDPGLVSYVVNGRHDHGGNHGKKLFVTLVA